MCISAGPSTWQQMQCPSMINSQLKRPSKQAYIQHDISSGPDLSVLHCKRACNSALVSAAQAVAFGGGPEGDGGCTPPLVFGLSGGPHGLAAPGRPSGWPPGKGGRGQGPPAGLGRSEGDTHRAASGLKGGGGGGKGGLGVGGGKGGNTPPWCSATPQTQQPKTPEYDILRS